MARAYILYVAMEYKLDLITMQRLDPLSDVVQVTDYKFHDGFVALL